MDQFGDHMDSTMRAIGSGSTSTWNMGSIMSMISQGMFFCGDAVGSLAARVFPDLVPS
jgi:hypothetical protein